jgi:hypothetical protein
MFAVLAAVALTASCALADSTSSTTTTTTQGFTGPGAPANPPAYTNTNASAVFLGGTPIFRVRVAGGGYTIEERAATIQQRLNDILSTGPIFPTDITTGPVGAEEAVYVKGKLIFTADLATAKFNDATPTDLANQWAQNLRNILPGLTSPK